MEIFDADAAEATYDDSRDVSEVVARAAEAHRQSRRSTRPFVHLHNHTHHSVLDGLQTAAESATAAAADGAPAVAITDHDGPGGALKLRDACGKAGIKHIIGTEAYLAFGSRHEREPCPESWGTKEDVPDKDGDAKKARGKPYMHVTLLAQNATGWRSMTRMTAAAAESVWSKPRVDFDLMREHSEGIIALTGCLGGPVLSPLVGGDEAAARANIETLMDIYGRERLFVEIMDHGISEERAVMPRLLELAKHYGLRTVATNDAHYTVPEQAWPHEVWLSAQVGKKVGSADTFAFHGDGYHMRTAAEMRSIFDAMPGAEEACDNTLLIASMIDDDVLPKNEFRLPVFDPTHAVPSMGVTACPHPECQPGAGDASTLSQSHFKHLVNAGLTKRYGRQWNTRRPDVLRQVNHEARVIKGLGFIDYFLICHDMTSWARNNNIRVGPGRGSGAGSIVAYAMGITNVDPLQYNLLFERFLDYLRKGMPDFDIDFEQAGQSRIFAYLSHRWGHDKVARIGTWGQAREKSAIQKIGAALLPDNEQHVAAKLKGYVPEDATLDQINDPDNDAGAEYRDYVASNASAASIADIAPSVVGRIKGMSRHACGVVISAEPLADLIPMRRETNKSTGEDEWVAVWDGGDIESIGLLKMDALGIRNLDIISETIRQVESRTGERIDIEKISLSHDDARAAKTWALLSEGRTSGVFQLESRGMQELASQVRPDSLEELSALLALYRPGPMAANAHLSYARRRAGMEDVDYFGASGEQADALRPILENTNGLIVYQEQIMQISAAVAGFGPANSGALRAAISKKKQSIIDELGDKFLAQAVIATEPYDDPADANLGKFDVSESTIESVAFDERTAREIWDGIKGAGEYAFNKSHSVAYGWLAYQTAWLKANYPIEYAASLLAIPPGSDAEARRVATMREVRADGFTIVPPDVCASEVTSLAVESHVMLGLGEIKGVGHSAAEAIVADRHARGPFRDVRDFLNRVNDMESTHMGHVGALIQAGALDSLSDGMGRRALMMSYLAIAADESYTVRFRAEWSPLEQAERERRAIGMALTVDPIAEHAADLADMTDEVGRPIISLDDVPHVDRTPVTAYGLLTHVNQAPYHNKTRMRLQCEVAGSSSAIEGVMWDRELTELKAQPGGIPETGSVVIIRGRMDMRAPFRHAGDDDTVEVAEELVPQVTIFSMDVVVVPADNPPVRIIGGPSPHAPQSPPPQPPNGTDSDDDLDDATSTSVPLRIVPELPAPQHQREESPAPAPAVASAPAEISTLRRIASAHEQEQEREHAVTIARTTTLAPGDVGKIAIIRIASDEFFQRQQRSKRYRAGDLSAVMTRLPHASEIVRMVPIPTNAFLNIASTMPPGSVSAPFTLSRRFAGCMGIVMVVDENVTPANGVLVIDQREAIRALPRAVMGSLTRGDGFRVNFGESDCRHLDVDADMLRALRAIARENDAADEAANVDIA